MRQWRRGVLPTRSDRRQPRELARRPRSIRAPEGDATEEGARRGTDELKGEKRDQEDGPANRRNDVDVARRVAAECARQNAQPQGERRQRDIPNEGQGARL